MVYDTFEMIAIERANVVIAKRKAFERAGVSKGFG